MIEQQGCETADDFTPVSNRQDAAGIMLHPLNRRMGSFEAWNVPGGQRGEIREVFISRGRD